VALPAQRGEDGRLVLELLESVEEDGSKSQRRLAGELGIALGLVNAYLNRCIRKGLIKVTQVPARRYAYYLTPQGFLEKSRLSIEYLTHSFSFFRDAKLDCVAVFQEAHARGFSRLALEGASDLAEIAMICARDTDTQVVGIIDGATNRRRLGGVPVVPDHQALADAVDAVVMTRIGCTQADVAAATRAFGPDRVLVPNLLLKTITKREAVL
jgi:DNA-binding MarR family transcriptional regulator